MREAILRKAQESADLMMSFFAENADALERCVRDVAERFNRGGRLIAMGNGGSSCDAQHIAVEFQHPIIEKRKPLPAMALTIDAATLTAIGNDKDFSYVFVDQLESAGAARRRSAGYLDLGSVGQCQSRPAPRARQGLAHGRLRRPRRRTDAGAV